MDFRLLTVREAASLLGKSEDWLRAQMRRGHGPPARKVSPRCIQIRLDDLREWADRLEFVNRPRLKGDSDPEMRIDLGEEQGAAGPE